jgi:diguanylate cyclase (GGDEF)-like protein
MFAMAVSEDSSPAAGDLRTMLKRAEDSKLGQHAQFESLLREIAPRNAELSSYDQYWFRYLQGWDFAYDGKYVEAISHLDSMIQQGTDPTLAFRGRSTLINVLILAKQHERAFIELQKHAEQAPTITDWNALRQGLSITAMLLNDVGDYDLALIYAEQLIARKSGIAACSGMQLKLSALYKSGRLTSATQVQEGIDLCVQEGELLHANSIRVYLGSLLIDNGRHEEALAELSKHYSEVIDAKYPRMIADFDVLLARIYRAKGNSAFATQYARHALDHGVKGEFTRPLIDAHHLLYEIAKEQGNPTAALVHYEQFSKADKGFLNDAALRDITYRRVKYEVDFSKQQIESLNKVNQVLLLEQQLSEKSGENFRLYVVLLIVSLAFIGLWAYRTRRLQQHFVRLSRRDALTGAFNRPHFLALAEQTLSRCYAAGEEACVAVCNLDHIETINVTIGHAAGDAVLSKRLGCFQQHLRNEDIVGRLDGETFGVMFVNSNSIITLERCETLREALLSVSTPGESATSASFGVSSTSTSGYDLNRLLADAEAALYAAKNRTGNQVVQLHQCSVR